MTKRQFALALEMAMSAEDLPSANESDLFDGFALPGFPVTVCTIKQMASLVRWQCVQFNGELDMENFQEIWANRRKFLIVG
jgi:hypothetical protein